MEWACFANRAGQLILGHGPFEALSEQPKKGTAFYRNDFALSVERPWLIPSRIEEIDSLESIFPPPTRAPKPPQWQEPEAGLFAEAFREIHERIRKGSLEKSVPVVSEKAAWSGPPARWARLPNTLAPNMRLFGWGDKNKGLLAATPEQLFFLEGNLLSTMALAGTARSEERELFAVDEKMIREHEFVAQTLLAKLSDLGTVSRQPRGILDLGELIHFHTPIEVKLDYSGDPLALIRRLHPTPALGPLPRTTETLDDLYRWRSSLGCPDWFGAPFGLLQNGTFEALVGIRMTLWDKDSVEIPAGCGLIEASRLVNEWRELRLKREAVKRIFGFLPPLPSYE